MALDVTFISSPLSVEERYGNRDIGESGGNLPPLGLAIIAAYVREKGFTCDIIDAIALNLSVEQILESRSVRDSEVIAFTALTSSYHRTVICAKAISKKFPDKLIVIGGQHPTIMKDPVLKENSCFDVVVYGEGELTFEELLHKFKEAGYDKERFLSDTETLSKINGLLFRNLETVLTTPPRPLIQDLNALPFPARDLLPMDRYIPLPNQYKRKPAANIMALRGCPYRCTFCSANAVFGCGLRMRSAKRVYDEIKHLVDNYGMKEISFWDDTLTVNKKWLHELCDLIINNRLDITWSCYARVNTIDLELLKKMKKAGCWNIFYGIESGSQELLDIIKKGITLDQIRKAIKMTKKAGIEVRGSFMIALPGETPEMARKTIDFAIELNPDYAQFSITTPYPGTELFEQAKKYGKLSTDFSKYHGWDAVFVPHGYKNKEEIYEMEKEAFRRFYHRPKYIIGRVLKIRTKEDILRYMKGFKFMLGFSK